MYIGDQLSRGRCNYSGYQDRAGETRGGSDNADGIYDSFIANAELYESWKRVWS